MSDISFVECIKAAAVPAALFVALTPGVIVTIPSQQSNPAPALEVVLVHALVFLLALAGLLYVFATYSTHEVYNKATGKVKGFYDQYKRGAQPAEV